MIDGSKYRFLYYTKRTQSYRQKSFPKIWQNKHFYVQKYPEEVEQNCLFKVSEKNADKIYAIVLICMIQTTFIPAI